MTLQDLLEAAHKGTVSYKEADSDFQDVLALLNGKADGMFKDVRRDMTVRADGQIPWCCAITITGGLSAIGHTYLASLRDG